MPEISTLADNIPSDSESASLERASTIDISSLDRSKSKDKSPPSSAAV